MDSASGVSSWSADRAASMACSAPTTDVGVGIVIGSCRNLDELPRRVVLQPLLVIFSALVMSIHGYVFAT